MYFSSPLTGPHRHENEHSRCLNHRMLFLQQAEGDFVGFKIPNVILTIIRIRWRYDIKYVGRSILFQRDDFQEFMGGYLFQVILCCKYFSLNQMVLFKLLVKW